MIKMKAIDLKINNKECEIHDIIHIISSKHFKKDHVHMRLRTKVYGMIDYSWIQDIYTCTVRNTLSS